MIDTRPWESTPEKLSSLIDSIILDFHPETLDDDIEDLLDDADNRLEAMEYLHEKLGKMIQEY